MCSFKTTHAKMAANNGAKYLKDTADPKGKYFIDIKKNNMEVTPTTPLRINSFCLLPTIEILFFNKNGMVKNNDPIDLKKTS